MLHRIVAVEMVVWIAQEQNHAEDHAAGGNCLE